MEKFALILVDPRPDLCAEWKAQFDGLTGDAANVFGGVPGSVSIVNGYFEDLPAFDCMVSAANSFGLMDGGVDLAITRFFGRQLEMRVQARILDEWLGEQPVGTSFIIDTGNTRHPFLAHTPTMRVPMQITRTDNVYLAMWAMLLAVRRHNATASLPIQTVACPGLGTATGRVPAREAARQMAAAWANFLNPLTAINWELAGKRQAQVRWGGDPTSR